ncbi:MAG: hypothetical protein Q8K75_00020 [Chlamydiales bacterium]|nr:hypothetical protein [Chlamydiales bacterium]
MSRLISTLLSLFLTVTVIPLQAIDLKMVWNASNFWNWAENHSYDSEARAARAFLLNLTNEQPYIMKVERDEQGKLASFHIHDGMTYSEEDFAIYKQKQSEYAREQLDTAEFLMSVAGKYPMSFYNAVQKYINKLEEVAQGEDWSTELSYMFDQVQFEVIRSKFDIPDTLLETYPHFVSFLVRNGLVDSLIEHGQTIAYDEDTLMPYLKAEGQLVPWSALETDYLNFPQNTYIYSKNGVVALANDIKPLSARSKDHGKGPAIQIVTRFDYVDYNYRRFLDSEAEAKLLPISYHSWVRLINEDGITFSFGLWGSHPHQGTLLNTAKYLVPHTGKVHNADPFEIEASIDAANKCKNIVTTTIAISTNQYAMLLDHLSELTKSDEIWYETNGIVGHDSGSFVIELLRKLSVAKDDEGKPLANNQHKMDVSSQLAYYGYFAGAKTLWKWQEAEKKRRDTIVKNLIDHGATQKNIDAVKFAAPLEFAQ